MFHALRRTAGDAAAWVFVLLLTACSGESPAVIDHYGFDPLDGRIAFNPDGTLLAARARPNETGAPFALALFEATSGRLFSSLPFDAAELAGTVFDANGRRVLTVQGRTICIWNIETRANHTCSLPLPLDVGSAFFDGTGDRVVAVPRTVAFGGDAAPQALVLDPNTWSTSTDQGPPHTRVGQGWPVPNPQHAELSADGRYLVAHSVSYVEVFDATTWQSSGPIEYRDDLQPITSAELAADGDTMLIRKLTEASLWRRRSRERAYRFFGLAPFTHSDLSRDGTRVVTVTQDRRALVWDTKTLRQTLDLKVPKGMALGAAFDPGGRSILVVLNDGSALAFDALTGEQTRTLSGAGLPFLQVDSVHAIALSANGGSVAARFGDRIHMWSQ